MGGFELFGQMFSFHVNGNGQLMRSTFYDGGGIALNNHIMSTGNTAGLCWAYVRPSDGAMVVESVQFSSGGVRLYVFTWGDLTWRDGNGNVLTGV